MRAQTAGRAGHKRNMSVRSNDVLHSFPNSLRPAGLRASRPSLSLAFIAYKPEPNPMPTILLDKQGAVATLTLNRPDVLNALDRQNGARTGRSGQELTETTMFVRSLLKGAGRGFMAGGDVATIHENIDTIDETIRDLIGIFHKSVEGIAAMPKPVIAAVHGPVAVRRGQHVPECRLRSRRRQCEVHHGLYLAGHESRWWLDLSAAAHCRTPQGPRTRHAERHAGGRAGRGSGARQSASYRQTSWKPRR